MSHGIFPTGWATCPHTKKINLKLLVLFLDEILSLKNKSCVIEKIPVPALCFVYSHSYNNYVKIVSTSTHQIKLKKILIKQKHVIWIVFYVNEETRPRLSFQELMSGSHLPKKIFSFTSMIALQKWCKMRLISS